MFSFLLVCGALANATCRCSLFQINDSLFPQVLRIFEEGRSVLAGFSCWFWCLYPVPKTTTVNSLRRHGKGLVAAELVVLAAVNCNYASHISVYWEMTRGQSLALSPFPNILQSRFERQKLLLQIPVSQLVLLPVCPMKELCGFYFM